MKDYDKNKKSSNLQYWDVNNLYGCAISRKTTVQNFKRIDDSSQLNRNFMKDYNKVSDEGYFLEVDVQYLKKLYDFHNDLSFSHK